VRRPALRLHDLSRALAGSLVCAAAAHGQYRVEQFTTNNGLPQNTISGIVQAPDGYLWISTYDGLVRYDGVAFTIFDRGTTPAMLDTQFLNLSVDGAGAVWAGTATGVLRYRDGVFAWFGPVSSGEGAQHPGDPRLQPAWVPGAAAGWRLDNGALVRGRRDGTRTSIPLPVADSGLIVGGEDAEGSVWIRVPHGLLRYRGGTFTTYDGNALFGSRAIRSVLADRDGTLWVGTNEKGLFRVTRRFLTTYTLEDGLLARIVYPIIQDRGGRIWIGAGLGVTKFEHGRFSSYTVERSGPGRYRLAPVVGGTAQAAPAGYVRSMYVDKAGRLWLASHAALLQVENGGVVRAIECGCSPDAMLEDRAGDLWAASNRTLVRVHGDSVRRYASADGLPDAPLIVLHEDASGTLWVGSRRGLARRTGERFVTLTMKDGLAGEHIRSLASDPDGTLWVGTFDSGLSRYKRGQFTNITTRDGLFSNGVFHMLEDARGQLWMSSNRGIYRVSRRQLDDFADGRIPAVTSIAYGTRDGMRSVEANGGKQPAGFKAQDGTLWFPTQDGVVVIDPVVAEQSTRAPVAVVNQLTVDGVPVGSTGRVRLAPGQSELEIGFTAPTTVHAGGIRFRYRLDGLTGGWADAGTSRRVHYSHLPPGTYEFRVTAGNSEGVWGTNGASLTVEVDPHFYQSRWFLVASVLTLLAFVAGGYSLRIRALKAQERRLTTLVAERTADLEVANERLHQLSIEDALTSLANKRRLDEFLAQEWQRSQRAGTPVSLLMVDVDHFKLYNDTYGHQAGDECLRRVAEVLGATIRRGTDLAARYGGEEFAIALSDTPEAGAPVVAETIRSRVEALGIPHAASSAAPHVTVSIGTATAVATEGSTLAELISAADRALYRAKSEGRNRVA
jgi:diguanylate cyclase (GGDEF)-like protein